MQPRETKGALTAKKERGKVIGKAKKRKACFGMKLPSPASRKHDKEEAPWVMTGGSSALGVEELVKVYIVQVNCVFKTQEAAQKRKRLDAVTRSGPKRLLVSSGRAHQPETTGEKRT